MNYFDILNWSLVWPDWAIYWTLDKFLKPLATINFAQISHILRQFLDRCQNLQFFYWNHFWAIFTDILRFFSGHTVGHWRFRNTVQPFYDQPKDPRFTECWDLQIRIGALSKAGCGFIRNLWVPNLKYEKVIQQVKLG